MRRIREEVGVRVGTLLVSRGSGIIAYIARITTKRSIICHGKRRFYAIGTRRGVPCYRGITLISLGGNSRIVGCNRDLNMVARSTTGNR